MGAEGGGGGDISRYSTISAVFVNQYYTHIKKIHHKTSHRPHLCTAFQDFDKEDFDSAGVFKTIFH